MKKSFTFGELMLLFATVFAVSLATSFAVVSLAHADSVSPTSSGTTHYLDSSTLSWNITSGNGGGGNWISITSPDGNECQAYNVGHGGVTNGDIPSGTYSMGGGVTNIGDRTFPGASGSVWCTLGDLYGGSVHTYWQQDGSWFFNVYSDNAFTTLVSSSQFDQNVGGGGGASSTPALEATSSIDQTQQNFGFAFFIYAIGVFLGLYIFKKN